MIFITDGAEAVIGLMGWYFVTPVVEHWLEREIAKWVHPM